MQKQNYLLCLSLLFINLTSELKLMSENLDDFDLYHEDEEIVSKPQNGSNKRTNLKTKSDAYKNQQEEYVDLLKNRIKDF